MELEFYKKYRQLFSDCLSSEKTELKTIVSPRKNMYMFDQNKIKANYRALLELAKLIYNLDEGILFKDMNRLISGDEWTVMYQHREFLLALFDAANIIKYDSEEKDINNPKIKLVESNNSKVLKKRRQVNISDE